MQHVVTPRTYVSVFLALIVLTILTYWLAYQPIEDRALSISMALGIATIKATLVVLFFMHVKGGRPLVWIIAASGFVGLGLLVVGTLHDYLSRGWLGG